MKKATMGRGLVAILLLGMMVSAASADLLVSNLGYASGGTLSWSSTAGSQFTVGSERVTLDSVVLAMQASSCTTFNVSIYSDSDPDGDFVDGRPLAVLETLSGSSTIPTDGEYTYTSTGLTLEANTSYWVIADTSDGGYNWLYSSSFMADSVNGASMQHFTQDPLDFYNISYTYEPQMFAVNASVPEPASVVLLILGGLVLRKCRRRA